MSPEFFNVLILGGSILLILIFIYKHLILKIDIVSYQNIAFSGFLLTSVVLYSYSDEELLKIEFGLISIMMICLIIMFNAKLLKTFLKNLFSESNPIINIDKRVQNKPIKTKTNLKSDNSTSIYDNRDYRYESININQIKNELNISEENVSVENNHTINSNITNNDLHQKPAINNKNTNSERVSKKTNNKDYYCHLSDEQLNKIFYFFEKNDIISNDMAIETFRKKFLKEEMYISCEMPVLREFYNNLSKVKGVYFKTIPTFLLFFKDSKTHEHFKYKLFTKNAKPISKLSNEIQELFLEF